jgi:hypothetical protein
MTRVFVDRREVPMPDSGLISLDQVLHHIETTEVRPGSVIRDVELDGTPVAVGAGAQTPLFQPQDTIEVFTAPLAQVARDSIGEAMAYLERVEKLIPSLSVSFQAYPGPEAFENLKQLYEGFYWLNLLMDRLALSYRFSATDLVVQGQSVRDQQARLVSIIRLLVDSQEKQEFLVISDLLEYEVLPFLPIWKDIFASLAEQIVEQA